MILSPSILGCDFGNLETQVKEAYDAGAGWLHVDVMDGCFVPEISFGIPVVRALKKCTDAFIDVHLMVTDPEKAIDSFIDAGADNITFHIEAAEDVGRCIDKIKSRKKSVGISIKPGTPVSVLKPYLDKVDMVLVMSVEPGYGGQKYMPVADGKIRELRTLAGPHLKIEVDGGINAENLSSVLECGADVIVAGTAVFGDNITESVKHFKRIGKQTEKKTGAYKRAAVILGGSMADYDYIKSRIHSDAHIICADRGYDHAVKMGLVPDAVIGDFDSIHGDTGKTKRIEYPVDKDYTDGELAVRYALDSGYADIEIYGALGGRTDHELANILLLKPASSIAGTAVITDEINDIYCLNDELVFEGKQGYTLSIIPIVGDMAGVSGEGLKYGLDNDILYFGASRGISNVITDDICRLTVKKGFGLVVLTRPEKQAY